jgi:hypothetical protein
MSPKQLAYVQRRAAGLGQERAAIEAGYSRASAKVSASRMERDPRIAKAIEEARKAARGGSEMRRYEDPESYLRAVVAGEETPDPVRVGAARALLPFLEPRKRAPKKSASPRHMQDQAARATQDDLLEQWAERARRVRARLKRT